MSGKSPELEAILKRWVEATVNGNGAVVRNLLSQDHSAQYCGSSREEFISGRDLQDGIEAHIGEIRNIEILDAQFNAHQFNETGWAISQCTLRQRETGNTAYWRVSVFFQLEAGIWKAHHVHSSFANDDHKIMGVDHMAFNNLLNSAKDLDLDVGRNGSATIMFTDIAGSTSLVEALGDSRWAEMVSTHVTQLAALVVAEDGRVIKTLGDGTMSTFPSAGSALRAAQAIQRFLATQTDEPRLRVRVGLHTGDVIEAGDDFFGTVVNKAARIAGATGPGEILVSDATRVMVGGARDFVFANSTELQLKGLEGTHVVHRLDWQT